MVIFEYVLTSAERIFLKSACDLISDCIFSFYCNEREIVQFTNRAVSQHVFDGNNKKQTLEASRFIVETFSY